MLVVTGFALKYSRSWWAQPMLMGEGHFAFRGTLHRVAAAVLLLSLGYHVVHLDLDGRDRALLRHMTPRLQDLRDLQDVLAYNLGLSNKLPVFGEFSYVEKLEYLAFLWGTLVMATSGFILWFNTLALRYFPKWVLDAATALHFYEAILATFSILIWHLYTVVFDPDIYPMDRVHLRSVVPDYHAEIVAESLEEDAGSAASPAPSAPETRAKPSDEVKPPDRLPRKSKGSSRTRAHTTTRGSRKDK